MWTDLNVEQDYRGIKRITYSNEGFQGLFILNAYKGLNNNFCYFMLLFVISESCLELL